MLKTLLRPARFVLRAASSRPPSHLKIFLLMPLLAAAVMRADTVTDTNFINRLYHDVLNRPPDPAGLSFGVTYLATSGNTPQGLALTLLQSDEYRTDLVTSYYSDYLGRAPDSPGLSTFVGELHGGATDQTVQSQIFGSGEYFVDNGSNNPQFISAIFGQLLQRSAAPFEQIFWQNFLLTNTRQDLAGNVLDTSEYLSLLVTGYYQSYLNRSPSSGELSLFVNQIIGGATDETVQAEILGSTEFYADAQIGSTPVPVPEPASSLLLGTGLTLLAYARRRFHGTPSRDISQS